MGTNWQLIKAIDRTINVRQLSTDWQKIGMFDIFWVVAWFYVEMFPCLCCLCNLVNVQEKYNANLGQVPKMSKSRSFLENDAFHLTFLLYAIMQWLLSKVINHHLKRKFPFFFSKIPIPFFFFKNSQKFVYFYNADMELRWDEHTRAMQLLSNFRKFWSFFAKNDNKFDHLISATIYFYNIQ